MPSNSPINGIPYPLSSDPPDGPGAIQNLVSWMEAHVAPRDRMAHFRFIAGITDIALANNAWTDVPFDTAYFDPLGLKTTSAGAQQSAFVLPVAGRWSFYTRVATTATDASNVYNLGIYNVTASTMISSRGQIGVANATPLDHYTEEVLSVGTSIKAQLYKAGTVTNYITHGQNLYPVAAQLICRWLGTA